MWFKEKDMDNKMYGNKKFHYKNEELYKKFHDKDSIFGKNYDKKVTVKFFKKNLSLFFVKVI